MPKRIKNIVRITKRNDRGFHQYGETQVCSYGSHIDVYESSAASGPHVWIKINERAWCTRPELGEATAHLNPEQARLLIERLQVWLKEIPDRWNK
jgi:hypothetical protein